MSCVLLAVDPGGGGGGGAAAAAAITVKFRV